MSNVTQLKAQPTTEHRAINQATAGSIQPRQHIYFIRDTNHQGFAIKVNISGRATWITEGRVRGGRKKGS